MSDMWTEIVDGTAVGPTGYVSMFSGDAVVQVLWDDERGVQVTMSLPDCSMTPDEIFTLRGLVDDLLATPAPTRQTTA